MDAKAGARARLETQRPDLVALSHRIHANPELMFEEEKAAVAWRDQLRGLGVDASCVADYPLDRFGRGDIYLVVPPEQWSRANEIVENLD